MHRSSVEVFDAAEGDDRSFSEFESGEDNSLYDAHIQFNIDADQNIEIHRESRSGLWRI